MQAVGELDGQDLNEEKFREIVDAAKPVVIRKLSFGECTRKWTLEYLTKKLADQEVIIHEARESNQLDFITKNFIYKKCKFSEFSRELSDGGVQKAIYLRSTCKDPKCRRPARIEDDFPNIAQDLKPASFIPFGSNNKSYYSSVLRISSKHSRLWTHFDLYDNVLCQVVGLKSVFLVSPSESKFMYLEGDKSKVQDFHDWPSLVRRFPRLTGTNPLEVELQPGDCLFIPSMWWHQVLLPEHKQNTNEPHYSIGFNIFWKDEKLERESLYAPNDIYGNKNLPPYEAALANLDKALKHLALLPGKYGEVYKEMFYREVEGRVGRRMEPDE